jgi:enoyl-CoA hydratase/carnithine racemase
MVGRTSPDIRYQDKLLMAVRRRILRLAVSRATISAQECEEIGFHQKVVENAGERAGDRYDQSCLHHWHHAQMLAPER